MQGIFKEVIALIKKKIMLAVITLIFSLICLFEFNSFAAEKIPNFGAMKEVYTKNSYFVVTAGGKINKFKLSDMETRMIARLFNTNNYVDMYIDNSFNPKIINPYIEIRIKSNRVINLYSAGNGFVYVDKKKQYYVDQNRYVVFFSYCCKKYTNSTIKGNLKNEKYRPITFSAKDFFKSLRKAECNYRIAKILKDENLSLPVKVVSISNENINLYEFKDNIDMELGAMKLASILDSGCWAEVPHYYKKGSVVACYFGENVKIIDCIQKIMGKEYAGYSEGNIVKE